MARRLETYDQQKALILAIMSCLLLTDINLVATIQEKENWKGGLDVAGFSLIIKLGMVVNKEEKEKLKIRSCQLLSFNFL